MTGIEPIPADYVDGIPQPPEFLLLAHTELGDAGGPQDGFEFEFTLLALDVAAGRADVEGLAVDSNELRDTVPVLDGDEASPIMAGIVPDVEDGDAALGDYDAEVTAATDPGTGVGTGTGGVSTGGGGGGGGGGVGFCHPAPLADVELIDPCLDATAPPEEAPFRRAIIGTEHIIATGLLDGPGPPVETPVS